MLRFWGEEWFFILHLPSNLNLRSTLWWLYAFYSKTVTKKKKRESGMFWLKQMLRKLNHIQKSFVWFHWKLKLDRIFETIYSNLHISGWKTARYGKVKWLAFKVLRVPGNGLVSTMKTVCTLSIQTQTFLEPHSNPDYATREPCVLVEMLLWAFFSEMQQR